MMVTYLELLEMMKNETQPKEIFYDNHLYIWNEENESYYRKSTGVKFTCESIYDHFELFDEFTDKYDSAVDLITEKVIEIVSYWLTKERRYSIIIIEKR